MAKPGSNETSPQRIHAWERQREALELRKTGMSFQLIADKLGYATAQGAYAAVKVALQKTLREPAEELRTMELERLDALLTATWLAAERGVPQAVDRVLKIMERRAAYLGLDAPKKIAPTDPSGEYEWLAGMGDSEIDREIVALVDTARARAALPASQGEALPLDGAREA